MQVMARTGMRPVRLEACIDLPAMWQMVFKLEIGLMAKILFVICCCKRLQQENRAETELT